MFSITHYSKTPHTPEKPIQSKLAKAITMDFLNHWKEKQPSCPFLIPHSTAIQPVTKS
ncbi:hypothetical protein PCANC_21413 [Puccinia coronata f. sp. avenae]|uniref:Uncharacterized protein n=1 Tax=Puccinia coronata f. sp. avenae TaxID=200324 RepID=A0A2N5UTC2_9BASI|nr:hypothetical protein PCANC_21413 [Puccinia coronata f. sp. avenae]